MSPDCFNFSAELNRVAGDSLTRGKIVTMTIAIAIANTVQLPTSQVNNPIEYWNGQLYNIVRNTLHDVGEQVIFNSPLAMELARMFWLLRYRAAHQSQLILACANLSFFENLFGVGSYISDENKQFIEDNKAAIYCLIPLAVKMISTPVM